MPNISTYALYRIYWIVENLLRMLFILYYMYYIYTISVLGRLVRHNVASLLSNDFLASVYLGYLYYRLDSAQIHFQCCVYCLAFYVWMSHVIGGNIDDDLELSWCQLRCHWRHWRLSSWQPPTPLAAWGLTSIVTALGFRRCQLVYASVLTVVQLG